MRTYTSLKKLAQFNAPKGKDWVKVFYDDVECDKRMLNRGNKSQTSFINSRVYCANKFLEKGLPFHIAREVVYFKKRKFREKQGKFDEITCAYKQFVMYVRPQDVDFAYLGRADRDTRFTHRRLLELKCLELCGKPLDYWLTQNQLTMKGFTSRIRRGWTFQQAFFTPKGGMTEWQLKRANKRDLDKFVNHANARKFK